MRRLRLFALLFAPVPLAADEAPGVNPADVLTLFQFSNETSRIGQRWQNQATFRAGPAIRSNWNLGAETPWITIETPRGRSTGPGDAAFNANRTTRWGNWSLVTGLQYVAPTASEPECGSGKHQVNPAAAIVRQSEKGFFQAFVYRQRWSVAGDERRGDINEGQYRFLTAYLSKRGWWVLLQPQAAVDYHRGGRTTLDLDFETGTMVGPKLALWVRPSGSDLTRDARYASLQFGIRYVVNVRSR